MMSHEYFITWEFETFLQITIWKSGNQWNRIDPLKILDILDVKKS